MTPPKGGRIRVVVVNSNLNVGGAERVLAEIARRMNRERFDVEVLCLYEAGPIGEALRAEGVPIFDRFLRHKADVAGAWRLVRHLRRTKPDVFYYNNQPLTQLWGGVAAMLAGVPVVATVFHFTHRRRQGAKRGRLLNRVLARRVDLCIALSERQKRYVAAHESVPEDRIVVVPNGIDLRRFDAAPGSREATREELGIDPSAPVAGIVAQLRPEKNHPMLLHAARAVLGRHPDAVFVIAGDGEERPRLEALAGELGIRPNVRFLGARSDVPELLAALDVAVLCSFGRVETFPLAVLEAMAAARPVVATAVGAVDEIVVDGATGHVVPEADVDALADRLNALFADGDARRAMGDAARERARELFGVETMVRRTEDALAAAARPAVRDVAIVVGPRPRLQGGVATHIRTLLSGGLGDHYDLVHLEVGFWDEKVSRARRLADGLVKVARLRKLLQRHRGALVHLNPSMDTRSFVRDVPMLLLAARAGSPVLVQFHGGLMDRPKALRFRPLRSVLLWALLKADLLLVLSRLQAESIERAFGPRSGLSVRQVPALFLDMTSYERRASSRTTSQDGARAYVFVGRIAEEKGLGELLEAAATLRSDVPGLVVHVAGTGPDEADLRRRSDALGLGDVVRWHGYVEGDAKLDLLAASDVFVLPSWTEGLPNALVEAMSMGLPVVVTDVGAMPEVVEDGVNGFVVPPRDERALTDRMLHLARSPGDAGAMGRRNLQVARDRFSLERQVETFRGVYGDVRAAAAREREPGRR